MIIRNPITGSPMYDTERGLIIQAPQRFEVAIGLLEYAYYSRPDVWQLGVVRCVAPAVESSDADIDHHDHNPFWSRSTLLGAFICSGGDL